ESIQADFADRLLGRGQVEPPPPAGLTKRGPEVVLAGQAVALQLREIAVRPRRGDLVRRVLLALGRAAEDVSLVHGQKVPRAVLAERPSCDRRSPVVNGVVGPRQAQEEGRNGSSP